MSVIYWLELGKALASGFALALPVMALMIFFHNKRSERFDEIKKKQTEFHEDLKKMDEDIDGLTRQLSISETEALGKFLTRAEHIGSINRLDASITELSRQFNLFTSQLITLARSSGSRDWTHDPGN